MMSSEASPPQAAPAVAPTAAAPVDSAAGVKTEPVAAAPITPPPAARPAPGGPSQAAASAPPATGAAQPPSAESVRLKEYVVYFTQNSTEIPIYAKDILSTTANLLKSFPETRALIEGHTDSTGDPALQQGYF